MDSVTRVIQVTNIAPQATRDQMHTLFSTLGCSIDDLRLYPTVRDASVAVISRCAFVKFSDPNFVGIAQHLNNTVFIDRAIIISPVADGEVPDETMGLQMASSLSGAHANGGSKLGAKMPPNVINRIEGLAPNAFIMTHDPRLESMPELPPYPPLPASTPSDKVEEIRRTVCVVGLDSTVSAQQCMEFFAEAGEVKYFRYCTRDGDPVKFALIEFTDQMSVVTALNMNDRPLGMSRIKVTHALQAITKPQAKSNEAAQREIEEAMSKVKEAQSLVSAAVDPLMGMLGASSRISKSRSRSRSRRRSRSRGRSSYNNQRSRSKDRRRRSRSRSRDRRRRNSPKRKRSKSRSPHKRRRSRSKDKKREVDEKKKDTDDKKKKETVSEIKKEPDNGDDKIPEEEEAAPVVENGDAPLNETAVVKEEKAKEENGKKSSSRRRSRSRSREKRRSRSRDRRDRKKPRSRSRERRRRSKERGRKSKSKERVRRSRSKERVRVSKSKERAKRSRSKERKERKRSRSRETKKSTDDSKAKTIARDYDREEQGFEQQEKIIKVEENLQTEDMEISNSP